MSIAPTIVFFGQMPTTIIMQSTTQFDGSTPQTINYPTNPVIGQGSYVFAPQAGGGLYNFHDLVGTQLSITILSISYKGGGTCTVSRLLSNVSGTPSIQVGVITTQGDLVFETGDLTLAPFEDLTFVSSGATNPLVSITAMLTCSTWAS
jgi:hypothetical protein